MGPGITSRLDHHTVLAQDVPWSCHMLEAKFWDPTGVRNRLWSMPGSRGPEPACTGPRGSTLPSGVAWAASSHLWNRLLEGSISQITVVC